MKIEENNSFDIIIASLVFDVVAVNRKMFMGIFLLQNWIYQQLHGPSLLWFSAFSAVLAGVGPSPFQNIASNHNPFFYHSLSLAWQIAQR